MGQWWWLSWQSGRFLHQRSAVWIPTSAKFLLNNVYCQLYWKDENKGKEAGSHLKKHLHNYACYVESSVPKEVKNMFQSNFVIWVTAQGKITITIGVEKREFVFCHKNSGIFTKLFVFKQSIFKASILNYF